MRDNLSSSVSGKARRGCWLAGLGILFLAAVGGGIWGWLRRPPDMEVVYQTNNHGIALMDQFDYAGAIPVFEKAVQAAPEWLPGRINLGIALLNAGGSDPAYLPRCKANLEEVLQKESDNPYAHFCLGILLMYQQDSREAVQHFESVLRKDPDDAYSWYWLGTLKSPGSDEQSDCFREALKRNRHLIGAIYGLAMNLRRKDPRAAEEFLKETEALKQANWENIAAVKYSQMGPYAELIGRTSEPLTVPRTGPLPLFQPLETLTVQLAAGVRWATAADLGRDAVGEVRRLVRSRFGATLVVLDYNRDGKPDLFLAGAVVDGGQVRDLLLRNDGAGRFIDVTGEAGLAKPNPTLGCCVADFDNDGYPDLFLTGVGVQKLFRNTGAGTFEDITAKAQLADLRTVCLTASAIDLDQDSDLDLLVCEYAATAEDAVKRLKGEQAAKDGGLVVYLQQGAAPPLAHPDQKVPPLDCRFQRASLPLLQGTPAPVTGLAASDMDNDRDLDLLLLAEGSAPLVIANDRLLHFRRSPLPDTILGPANWNGALVLDVNHDGRSDLLVLRASQEACLLLNRSEGSHESAATWFEPGTNVSPPLRQAVAVDIDLDSWTDVAALTRDGQPVLLHNEGGRLVLHPEAFGQARTWPKDLIALAVCDGNGDALPDLFVWSESQGLSLYENRGNGNHGLEVELIGRNARDVFERMRCNTDGVGVWAVAQAGELWAGQENTTLCAGLGQARQPLLLGLARHQRAEALRLRWPDGTWQGEADLPAGQLHRIGQRNRMAGSCPILFAWDGRRFAFVTDFLGAGSLGETAPDGTCRPPRPEESVKIESRGGVTPPLPVPRDGQYVLKITEPMDETTYLDHLQLVVLDHPPGVRVYPDERFVTTGPPPSQQLIAFREEIHPVSARDHRDRDVTATLRHWDRHTVADFAKRAWTGFAEEHAIELDFGDRLSAFRTNDRLFLCVAGWTDYPFPESSWAAQQAGVLEQWPILERQDELGQWQSLGEAGFPAGLPRMMLREVTGLLTGPRCRLRLRTNMQIYWDQVFIAARCRTVVPDAAQPDIRGTNNKRAAGFIPAGWLRCRCATGPAARFLLEPVRATCLEVHTATLEAGRIVKESSPDGRAPALYDYHRHEEVPLVRQAGRVTRFGDVTELLRDPDDRFVIFGPGDDLTVRFDTKALPLLPAGWQRSFVLRTRGYCKDVALSTAAGATVEPLPFRGMRTYPSEPNASFPSDVLHRDYLRDYLTREVKADRSPRR